jgi:methylmalonyl-CoA mutase
MQGSFIVEELTELVEEAVLAELDRLSDRGGVLGAMETGYQRGRIQDDSMAYEHAKHDGSLPIIGVNMFTAAEESGPGRLELARATEDEKEGQIVRLAAFHQQHADGRAPALAALREAALSGANVFESLMDTVRSASLGDITQTLFEVGGIYRRNV